MRVFHAAARHRRVLSTCAVIVVALLGSIAFRPVHSSFSGSAGNPGNTWTSPATWCTAGNATATATADAPLDQSSPSSPLGTASSLVVGADSSGYFRSVVKFTLPTVPAGCVVSSATLRFTVTATSMSGRTIQAFRSAAAWSESTVTWNNQPSTTGTACTGPSVTSGNFEADVLSCVQALYSGTNNGFLIRDSVETLNRVQQWGSSEGSAANQPRLIVAWS